MQIRRLLAALPLVVQQVSATVGALRDAPLGACSSADDCSLNGDCIANVCVCDPWWRGSANCDVLAFVPADPSTGYFNATASSWGGLPLYDDASGLWHLFVAEMMNECGLWTWKNNSRIIRATSTSQNGPFQFADVVVAPFAHNPKAIRAPDGTILVFFIGGWQTTPADCSTADNVTYSPRVAQLSPLTGFDFGGGPYPGPRNDTCGPEPPFNGGCGLSVAFADSVFGPWSIMPIGIQDQNASALLDCAHTNPSPFFLPDGRLVVMFNGGFCHNGVETIGMLQAPSWLGPYKYRSPVPLLNNSDGSVNVCEDPSMWVDARGWHALVHSFDARIALYAHSRDGYSWTLHSEASNPGPYDGNVLWANGSVTPLDLQRPQLTFDASQPSQPLYLINGAVLDEDSGRSFTLFRPLRQV